MGRSNLTYFTTETTKTKDLIPVEICESQKRGLCFAKVNYHLQNDAKGAPRPGNNFSQSEV